MGNYRRLLRRADAWYRSVQASHPREMPCRKGCRDCCLGLFDISPADADLLREGLAQADPAVREDIRARAAKILADLPGIGETLEGLGEEEIDEICDRPGPVECPVLGPGGECRLYEYRPLTCRLAGAPIVDTSGRVIAAEGCSKCTLRASDTPPLDYAALREEEERILRKRYGAGAGVTLLIPQAVK